MSVMFDALKIACQQWVAWPLGSQEAKQLISDETETEIWIDEQRADEHRPHHGEIEGLPKQPV